MEAGPPQGVRPGAAGRPAFGPAVWFAGGVVAATHLSWLPIPALLALIALGLARGRRWARRLACSACGLLTAAVWWLGPLRQCELPDPGRPVELTVRIEGRWQRRMDGWSVRARLLRLRQGSLVGRHPRRLTLLLSGEAPPPVARQLRVRGYLRPAAQSYNDTAAPARLEERWSLRVKSRRLLVEEGSAGPSIREAFEQRLFGDAPSGPGSALARTLLLGDPSGLDPALLADLRRVGLAHLVSVSGLHVGLLLLLVLGALSPSPKALRDVGAAAALLFYLVLVGPQSPLVRAAAMACLWLLGQRLGRRLAGLQTLAIVGAAVLSLDPSQVAQLDFRLTCLATFGILFLAPGLGGELGCARGAAGRVVLALRRALAVSVAAQLLTLPDLLATFSLLSPLAPMFNLVAVPWTAVALAGSVLAAAGALALGWELERMSPLLDPLAAPFAWLVHVPPGAPFCVPLAGGFATTVIITVLAALGLHHPKLPRPAALATLLVAPLLAPVLLGVLLSTRAPRHPEVVMIDVGQGESVLLRDRERTILIDGGGWRGPGIGSSVLLPALARLGVQELDVAISSHGDRDHCAGLVEIARIVPIERLWVPHSRDTSPCAGELERWVQRRSSVGRLSSGQRLSVGAWRFEVLNPKRASAVTGNSGSLVLRVSRAGYRLLLTGDIERAVEAELLADGASLESDVLKIAHHGSRTSTGPAFLAAVAPRIALISAGRGNSYGHPHDDVVRRLAERRITTLRTDRDGRMRLVLVPGGPIRLERTLGVR